MFRITRTSTTPIDPLSITMNLADQRAAGFEATAATADGPTFSEVVDDEIGEIFAADEGLRQHFTSERID